MIGQTLGQFRITRELGKGGFATVYRALQPTLNRDVAIKVLHPEFIRDERALRRFKREALAVAQLAHPNIVRVYDYGEQEGRAYLVMEFVAGDTLKGRLGKPVSYSFALEVISAVSAALDYAHAKGMVHRDIKPANILFTEDNRILLSDFGIVRLAGDDSSLTRGVIGTPQYMAPEQALGHEVDSRGDLYALGIVLFEMLTGSVPFRGESAIATLSMHVTLPVPSARERNPGLPEVIDRVVRRALAKAPEERYQTGRDLREALAQAVHQAEHPTASTVVVPAAAGANAAATALDQPLDLDELYEQLLQLTRLQDWRSAVNLAAQILARDPSYRDVNAILSTASNELRFGRSTTSVDLQVADLIRGAEDAIAGSRLMEAASSLQQVLRMSPDHPTARQRLDDVNRLLTEQEDRRRRQARLEQLYGLAVSKIRARDWRWAGHILDEINAIDPFYRDVPELLTQVRAALHTQRSDDTRADRVASLRSQAEQAMRDQHWREAAGLLQAVLDIDPSLNAVREEMEEADRRATLAELNAKAAGLAADGRFDEAIQVLEHIKRVNPPRAQDANRV